MPVAQAIRKIFELCSQDVDCNQANPGIENKTDSLIRRWLKQPMVQNGHTYPIEDLSMYLMDNAYYGAGARQIPYDLTQFVEGDFKALGEFNQVRSVYAEALRMGHLCKERLPFEDRNKVMLNAGKDPIAIALSTSLIRHLEGACDAFPVGEIDPRQNEPVKSDIPTLILAPAIDPGCPPELAEKAIGNFSHGQLIVIPNATHSVAETSSCAASLGQNFLRNINAKVDDSCIKEAYAKFEFRPSKAR
jgi:TAP-like protein.